MSFSVESPGGRGAPLQASILRSPAPHQIGRGSWVRSLCLGERTHKGTGSHYHRGSAGSFTGGRWAAAAHGATPRQVALAFLLLRPSLFGIPKASRPEHVEENAAAGDLVLSEDEARRIDEAFPRGRRRPGVPTL